MKCLTPLICLVFSHHFKNKHKFCANLVILGKESHVGRLRRLPRQGGGRRGSLAPRRGRVLHATNASAMIDRRCDFKAF